MKYIKNTLRFLLLISIIGMVGVFLPIIPVNSKKLGDPITPYDERISVKISETDLEEILGIIRRGHLNSIYEILYFQTHAPLLKIHKSMPTYRVSPKPMEEIPPLGTITVTTGAMCGVLCGSGMTYL